MLELADVTLRFAGITALDRVCLSAAPGELVGVIGPNGAGKTTLFNVISGLARPSSGWVRFGGVDLLSVPAHRRAALGIARMFQNVALYGQLTVLENLLVGRHPTYRTSVWHDLLRSRRFVAEEVRHRHVVEELIHFLDLEAVRHVPAAVLPYGLLKRVELGRALALEPSLLLLDEPAAGLNQEETEDLARYLLDLKEERGLCQILIEHDLHLVLDVAERIVVLDFGRTLAEGSPAEIRRHPEVRRAYSGLGEDSLA